MLRSFIAGRLSRGDRFYPTSGLNPNDPVDKCPAFCVLTVWDDRILAIAETPIPRAGNWPTAQWLCESDLSGYRHQLEEAGVITGKIKRLRLPTVEEYIWAQDLDLCIQEPGELTCNDSSDYTLKPRDDYGTLIYISSDNRFYDSRKEDHDAEPFCLRPLLELDAKTLVLLDDSKYRLHVELSD